MLHYHTMVLSLLLNLSLKINKILKRQCSLGPLSGRHLHFSGGATVGGGGKETLGDHPKPSFSWQEVDRRILGCGIHFQIFSLQF